MSNKIPCGGFKLDNNFLGMNENDELSLTSGSEGEGKAYKQLVTDGTGTAKWEDRLAYDDSKLFVDFGGGARFVKVSDEVPSWASVDAPVKFWLSNGTNNTIPTEGNRALGNGSFMAEEIAFFITTDNTEYGNLVFPKKGVYFFESVGIYTAGIASADSDTPEITWDGNIGGIKKLDEKFLPEPTVFYVDSNRNLVDAKGVKITLAQAKAVGLNFIIQTDSGVAKPISAFYSDTYASFYVAEGLSSGNYNFIEYYAGEQPVS